MAPSQLTQEEIERMRQIVLQHDAASKPVKEFDLNNPPKEPYRHQEFPRLMYKGTGHALAHTKEDMEAALAAGWSKTPHEALEQTVEPELDEATAAEAAAVDLELKKPKKGK